MTLTQPHFDGTTYSPELDQTRLGRQLDLVAFRLSDGHWWTLGALQGVCGGSEAGISARIRDLRKARYGGHLVQRKRLEGGQWAYRMIPQSLAELT